MDDFCISCHAVNCVVTLSSLEIRSEIENIHGLLHGNFTENKTKLGRATSSGYSISSVPGPRFWNSGAKRRSFFFFFFYSPPKP